MKLMTQISAAARQLAARMRENSEGYVRELRFFLVAAAAASLADMAATIWFMLQDGVGAELHPVVRLVSYVLGPVLGPVVGKTCQFAAVVLVTIYFRKWAKYIFVLVILLYAFASWYNIWGKYVCPLF